MKYNWYVTYSFRAGYSFGNGCVVLDTASEWFPIKKASEFILKNKKVDSLIIQDWKLITDEQALEFNPNKEGSDVHG